MSSAYHRMQCITRIMRYLIQHDTWQYCITLYFTVVSRTKFFFINTESGIGESVNLASRLMGKAHGRVLVDESTYTHLHRWFNKTIIFNYYFARRFLLCTISILLFPFLLDSYSSPFSPFILVSHSRWPTLTTPLPVHTFTFISSIFTSKLLFISTSISLSPVIFISSTWSLSLPSSSLSL